MPHFRFNHFAARTRKLCLAAAAALATCAALAPSASAGVLVNAADSCGTEALSQPFLPWLDAAPYTLLSGGSFEGTLTGWTLSKARVVSGNEPYYVHGRNDKRSLSLPAGSQATSAVICVGLAHPTMRFFAVSSGGLLTDGLKVEVLFELANGAVAVAPIGVVPADAHRTWQPTLPMAVVANLLPLLPGERTPVAFRFTPVGGAGWTIDDVYVDPRYR